MQIKQSALDSDGYIVDQRQTDNISFGRVSSSKNGCGWIACYNFLKALDQTPEPEALVRRLEKTLPMGGMLGMHLFALLAELHQQNIPLDFALRPFHAEQISENCSAGIVLYDAGRRNHFAAFRREENGKLRFYGAIPGRRNYDISMAEFYWEHVKFPLALTITAKQKR